ncbi:MAG: Stk1 family PASTA domain-containing Ser/Thr kinase [Flaviflexus sp.]|nr:Stk1 family PASTA domain-containing Ser/Thr kinase [Flaviflexus sp.]
MTSAPDPLLGTVIDERYRIRARIARGGMATVYRARDEKLERDVAVKVMHPHLADQEEFVDRFAREARASAKLSSPHVVQVYDEGTFADGPYGSPAAYIVMEHVSGDDLRTELSRRGSFSLREALEILIQVLSGLGAAHRAGLIHRDVKPENVLIERGESRPIAKVTDFGLARAVAAASTTSTGTVLGTVAYLAPEMIEQSPDARSDVYGAGIMLYELIAGQVPFTADSPIALAYKHVNETMPRLSALAPWIPPALDSLIGLLTAKDPDQRPADGIAARDRVIAVADEIDDIIARRRVAVIPTRKPEPRTATRAEASAPSAQRGDTRSFTPASRTRQMPKNRRSSAHEVARRRNESNRSTSKRGTFWRWLMILLLIAGAAAGVAWYFLAGPGMRIPLPDLAGREKSAAVKTIEGLGFTPEVKEAYSDEVKVGHVISTSPAPPADLPKGEQVVLTVSLGIEQIEVPAVTGQLVEDAKSALEASRFTVDVTDEYSQDVPLGHVISQTPAAGEVVNHSSLVKLVVSLGREPVAAPSVEGKTAEEARAALEEAGLVVEASEQYSDTVPAGTVISQSTSEQFYRGDTVSLTVSKGPELFEVPDVFGMSTDEATNILDQAGFNVAENRVLGGIFDRVRDQDPAAGTMVPRGTTITITIV